MEEEEGEGGGGVVDAGAGAPHFLSHACLSINNNGGMIGLKLQIKRHWITSWRFSYRVIFFFHFVEKHHI